MKTKLLITFLAVCAFEISNAQNTNETYQIKKKNFSGVPTSIEFSPNSNVNHENFITEMKDEFKFQADDKLELIKTTKDKYGSSHYKYAQKYKDINIVGAQYIIHEKDGKATYANGKFYSTLSLDTTPSITKDEAITNAMKYCGLEKYRWQDTACENSLKRKTKKPNATYYPKPVLSIAPENGIFKLCWKFNIAGVSLRKAWTVFIDANDGHLVNKISIIKEGDVTGSSTTLYNGTKAITCFYYPTDGKYYLEEYGTRGPTNSQTILTRNLNNDTTPNWGSMTDFPNATTSFTSDPVANQVHWGVEKAYDFYYSNYQRNSFDDNGHDIVNLVHYGNSFNNAHWDPYDTLMAYGDGDGVLMNAVVGLDVAGHELTHAFTEYTANLTYQGESGALDESFSDIFGTGIEFFALGVNANWTMGENIVISSACTNHNYFRSMSNPKAGLIISGSCGNYDGRQPNTYGGQYWNGGGDVHINSGVQNYWFYLLSQGGSGVNDNGDSYSVNGIGIDIALLIAYSNVTFMLTDSSNYSDAMNGSIQAAAIAFGILSPEVKSVKDAWCAVGVGPCSPTNIVNIISSNSISVFPNPSNGIFTISSFLSDKNINLKIENVLGEEIFHSEMLSNSLQVDLRKETNGIYFIEINSENGTTNKKIIINK
ncbi:MAG: M4 family metallopeptidase [Bacteroidetes bacterium]|nr:M4 family metallopeptidase [Bacteroidota bacterium]